MKKALGETQIPHGDVHTPEITPHRVDMFHCFMLRLLLIARNYYYLTYYCN